VTVQGEDGATYVFRTAGKTGPLTCDVPDEATVAKLLRLETFIPVNEADFDVATKLVGGDDDDDLDPDGDHDDAADQNAPPEEANTPPRPRRKRAQQVT
ncbi:MAG TPA: hypothetical protein PLV68_07505, partial [Ilumatobacteraceae bacterium]|nr:hypothetical protein [Ilumatobacteraceae bacterium]